MSRRCVSTLQGPEPSLTPPIAKSYQNCPIYARRAMGNASASERTQGRGWCGGVTRSASQEGKGTRYQGRRKFSSRYDKVTVSAAPRGRALELNETNSTCHNEDMWVYKLCLYAHDKSSSPGRVFAVGSGRITLRQKTHVYGGGKICIT